MFSSDPGSGVPWWDIVIPVCAGGNLIHPCPCIVVVFRCKREECQIFGPGKRRGKRD